MRKQLMSAAGLRVVGSREVGTQPIPRRVSMAKARGLAAACLTLVLGMLGLPGSASAQANGRPHIVFVMTDDQRFDTLWAMPILLDEIASRGIAFTDTIVTTPSCGQTRSSILAGGYLSQNTSVLTNGVVPGSGGFARFEDSNSLAVQLQRSGYRTQRRSKTPQEGGSVAELNVIVEELATTLAAAHEWPHLG